MEVREASGPYAHLSAPSVCQALPGYKQTEVGVIPEEWSSPKIESLVDEISMGPFGSDIKVSNFISSGVPVLNGANVSTERLKDSFVNFVSFEKSKSLKKAVARRGDVVVTHRGTIGQISYIPDNSAFDRYVVSQSQFRVRFTSETVIPAWVVLYFHSERGVKRLLDGKGHTGVPAISSPTKTFRDLCIPLPPIAEQRAIVRALSDADALIESLEQLIAKKRQIKQGTMQALLTPSEGWIETSLLELVGGKKELFDDGDWIESEHITDAGVRLIQTGNIGVGEFVEKDLKKYIFEASFISLRCKEIVEGDLLICRLADPAGRACVLPDIGEAKVVTSVDVTIFRPSADVANRKFLAYLFSTDDWFRDVSDRSGGTTHKRISRGALGRIEIKIPRVEEQAAIATILTDMDTELAEFETRLAKTRQLKQGMMQELLTGRIRLV
jgi:type I restriction enzyme S subunit